MRKIDSWFWFNGCRVRGTVNGESFSSRAAVEVNPERSTLEVQGGEVFLLGERAEHEEMDLKQLAEVVRRFREREIVS